MNIDIIRRNIEQVISQPCKSKYPDEIKPNGISPDGNRIFIKVRPDDSSRQFFLSSDEGKELDIVALLLAELPEKYSDHLVTLRHSDWIYYSYVPVFDTDTQAMWDKELDDYITRKAEWCQKYGCD